MSQMRERGREIERTPTGTTAETPGERGHRMLELSNAVVRVHKQMSGKGPTKARAYLQQDLLVVLLEGGFTRSEETLHAGGHDRELQSARRAMQDTAEVELRRAVEGILGRRVRSIMSANDPTEGLQADIFILDPDVGDIAERVVGPDVEGPEPAR